MTITETLLYNALKELVCCSAFNGQVFEKDKESHIAWTHARYAISVVEEKEKQP